MNYGKRLHQHCQKPHYYQLAVRAYVPFFCLSFCFLWIHLLDPWENVVKIESNVTLGHYVPPYPPRYIFFRLFIYLFNDVFKKNCSYCLIDVEPIEEQNRNTASNERKRSKTTKTSVVKARKLFIYLFIFDLNIKSHQMNREITIIIMTTTTMMKWLAIMKMEWMSMQRRGKQAITIHHQLSK